MSVTDFRARTVPTALPARTVPTVVAAAPGVRAVRDVTAGVTVAPEVAVALEGDCGAGSPGTDGTVN
jgi:hypothetical protein